MKFIRVLNDVTDAVSGITIKRNSIGVIDENTITFKAGDVVGAEPKFDLSVLAVIGNGNYRIEQANDSGLKKFPLGDEAWRKYTWIDPESNKRVAHTVHNPVDVYFYKGSTTHRVVDVEGVVHCVPSVGVFGCVLTWKNKDGKPAVQW